MGMKEMKQKLTEIQIEDLIALTESFDSATFADDAPLRLLAQEAYDTDNALLSHMFSLAVPIAQELAKRIDEALG